MHWREKYVNGLPTCMQSTGLITKSHGCILAFVEVKVKVVLKPLLRMGKGNEQPGPSIN